MKRDHTVRGVDDEDWNAVNEIRKNFKLKWSQFFGYLNNYSNMMSQMLVLPPDISKTTLLGAGTALSLMPLWMDNLRDNFGAVQESPDIKDMTSVDGGTALLIGAGPSLYDNPSGTDHLEVLAESGFQDNGGIVIATDRILKDCLEHGVVPDYFCVVDGSENILPFLDHEIIDQYRDEMEGVMCAMSHPDVVKRWKGKTYFYISDIAQELLPNVAHTMSLLLRRTVINTGGHCGGFCWNLAVYLGCKTIGMIGMDLSYKTTFPIEQTAYYKQYANAHKNDSKKIVDCFRLYKHPFFGTGCYTDYVFDSYEESWRSWFKLMGEKGVRTINATEGGILEEEVECGWFKDFLQTRGDNVRKSPLREP